MADNEITVDLAMTGYILIGYGNISKSLVLHLLNNNIWNKYKNIDNQLLSKNICLAIIITIKLSLNAKV